MQPSARKSIRTKVKLRHIAAQSALKQKHPEASSFFEQSGIDLGKIRAHSTKLLTAGVFTAGAISGALLLPTSVNVSNYGVSIEHKTAEVSASVKNEALLLPPATVQLESTSSQKLSLPRPVAEVLLDSGGIQAMAPRQYLTGELGKVLPPISNRFNPPFLTRNEEKVVEQIVTRATGIPTKASLEGEHLNTTYGYIGAEQHLARYPGDTLAGRSFPEIGMAPGLGGFGYFNEGGPLTRDALLREKYYVVAQLMYLPDWGKRTRYLAAWYKWRKIIVVNPENGNAVVGDMGDAGPAAWTGKHFGGSPEVMNALGGPKYKKGRVLFFFVDDPENKIPLGPVRYDEIPQQVLRQI